MNWPGLAVQAIASRPLPLVVEWRQKGPIHELNLVAME